MEVGLVRRIATEAFKWSCPNSPHTYGKDLFLWLHMNRIYNSAQLPNRASETIDEIQQT